MKSGGNSGLTECTAVAPLRVDFAGGFTDVSPFSQQGPMAVVNATLALEVQVRLWRTSSGPVAGSESIHMVDRITAIASRRFGLEDIAAQVCQPVAPMGSGLGGSSALAVAIVIGVSHIAGARLSRRDTVEHAWDAEQKAGVSGGVQDIIAASYGGFNFIEGWGPLGSRASVPGARQWLGPRLKLIHPGGSRNSSRTIDVVRRSSMSRTTVERLRRSSLLAMKSIAERDLSAFANSLDDTTDAMEALGAGIVDASVRKALAAGPGVVASKPCGAGGSSAVWVVVVSDGGGPAFEDYAEANGWHMVSSDLSARRGRVTRSA